MKPRYLHKLILTYSVVIYCVVLLVLSVSAIFIQKKNYSVIQTQEKALFRRWVSDYEALWADMFNISNDIKKMTSLDLFALSSGRNYYAAMTDLQKDLRNYSQQYQRSGYGIAVHRFSDEKMVTDEASIDLQYLLPETGLSSVQYSSLLHELSANNRGALLALTDQQAVYLTARNYLNQEMIILIHYPLSRLVTDETLDYQFALTTNDSSVRDFRSDAPSEYAPDSQVSDDDISDRLVKGHLCLQTRSHFYDITYSSISPTSIYSAMFHGVLYILLTVITVFTLILLLIIRVSRRIYRPIHDLVAAFSGDESRTNEQYGSEIDFIAGKVQTIQRQNQQLLQRADIHRRLVIQGILMKLVGNTYRPSSIRPAMSETDVLWLDSPCFLILFDLPLRSQEPLMAGGGLVDVLRTYFSKDIPCIYMELAESGVCCVLPSGRFGSMDALRLTLRAAFLTIETETGCTLTAYVAPESQDMDSLSSSYNIAVFMREESPRLEVRNVYFYKDYEKLFETSTGYPLTIERDLIDAVIDNDESRINKVLDELFDIYIGKTFFDKNLREMNIISLINTINRALQKAALDISSLLSRNSYLLLELKMSASPLELRQKARDIFLAIAGQCGKKQSLQKEDLAGQLKAYIEKHYSRDVALGEIAEYFSLSPNYMSLIFKRALNCTFKDYLNKFRCEKARELLSQNPQLRIADIAVQVGFLNANTFIRVFKKDCGISPGQYQSQHAEPF